MTFRDRKVHTEGSVNRSRRGHLVLVPLLVTSLLALQAARAPRASASMGCEAEQIRINSGPGAEPPSWAWGHSHRTGNHYVGAFEDGVWYWWADNNGGVDGDTQDTYIGAQFCG